MLKAFIYTMLGVTTTAVTIVVGTKTVSFFTARVRGVPEDNVFSANSHDRRAV
jgi:hypothetical protein